MNADTIDATRGTVCNREEMRGAHSRSVVVVFAPEHDKCTQFGGAWIFAPVFPGLTQLAALLKSVSFNPLWVGAANTLIHASWRSRRVCYA